MREIHCYNCGGFIDDPSSTSYRAATSTNDPSRAAVPNSALCTCKPPVVRADPRRPSSPRLN